MLKQGPFTTVQTLFMFRGVLRTLIQSHVARAGVVSVHVGPTGSQLHVVSWYTDGQITLVIDIRLVNYNK